MLSGNEKSNVMPMPKIDGLEVLRGLAALVVLLHHALATIQLPWTYNRTFFWDFFSTGQFGVDIFFVLSGFIIFYTNPRDGKSAKEILKYGLKRTARIYSIYWIICLAFIPLVLLIPSASGNNPDPSAANILQSVFLFPYETSPMLVVAWTLKFEIMFYVLYVPFLIAREWGWILWSSIAASASIVAVTGTDIGNVWIEQILSLRTIEFLLGGLVCIIVKKRLPAKPTLWIAMGTFGLLLVAILELNYGREFLVVNYLYYACAASFLVFGLVGLEWKGARGMISNRKLVALGSYSYSIYLVHYPVQQLLTKIALKITGPSPGDIVVMGVFVFVVVTSLFAGIVFSRMIEFPILRYIKRKISAL